VGRKGDRRGRLRRFPPDPTRHRGDQTNVRHSRVPEPRLFKSDADGTGAARPPERLQNGRLETGDRQPEAIRLYESSSYRRIPNFGIYRDSESSVCFEKQLGS